VTRTPDRVARAVIDANRYMTIATADSGGRPWITPVWFAHDAHTEFLWVSRPDARHSRNIAERGDVAIVIFDSTVTPRERQAVYVEAVAEQLTGPDCERAITVYARRSVALGEQPWGIADVTPPAEFRLYRATASMHFVLHDTADRRIPADFPAPVSTPGA